MKEGVVMAEALGQELLIDLYSCDEDAISSATAVQESVATAFDLAALMLMKSVVKLWTRRSPSYLLHQAFTLHCTRILL